MYETTLYNVDANQLNSARAFWECAGDVFVIDHYGTEDLATQELGVEVGFTESGCRSGTDLGVSLREQLSTELVLPSVVGVGAQPSIEVLGVVGVELTLNDYAR